MVVINPKHEGCGALTKLVRLEHEVGFEKRGRNDFSQWGKMPAPDAIVCPEIGCRANEERTASLRHAGARSGTSNKRFAATTSGSYVDFRI